MIDIELIDKYTCISLKSQREGSFFRKSSIIFGINLGFYEYVVVGGILMKINVECVSGEKHTIDMHDKQIGEFQSWLTNGNSQEVFVYRKNKFTLCLFKSKIECVHYIE